MRLFYGIQLPEEVREHLFDAMLLLQSYIPSGVKWVEKENLNITFQFIGETKPTQLADLEENFLSSIAPCNEQKFILNCVDLFPVKQPRIIWVRLDSDNKQFTKATKYLRTLLTAQGFNLEDRDLIPHITLGRIKNSLMKPQIEFILQSEIENQEFIVNQITLFESNLSKRGAKYRILNTYNL